MFGGRGADNLQRIAVSVGVVAQHVDGHRRVLVRVGTVVIGQRIIVHWRDRHGHFGCVCAAVAIADLVGDRVVAVIVRIRRVGQCAVGIHRHRAVQRCGRADHFQRVALGVGVIAQNIDGDRCVLVGAGCVIIGNGANIVRQDQVFNLGKGHGASDVAVGIQEFDGARGGVAITIGCLTYDAQRALPA